MLLVTKVLSVSLVYPQHQPEKDLLVLVLKVGLIME